MKPTPIGRRSFFGFLFSIFVASSCKKTDPTPDKPVIPPVTPPPITPPTSTPPYDLGSYSITEYGDGLADGPDLSKLIYGYSDKLSYNQGDTISLYLSAPANNNQKISLYNANGQILDTVKTPIDVQKISNSKPWVDGCGFNKTFDYKLPANLKSGIYDWTGHFSMVVKSDSNNHDITIVYPSNTSNAYNQGGGKSLYVPAGIGTVASFSRIRYAVHDYTSSFFSWMNLQPYDANYIADIDLDDYSLIQNSKLIIVTGHSEYWTRQARENIDKFVASGKNVLILAGNTMWWQVRYNQPKNLMICYKNNESDPLKDTIYSTINWPQPLLNYPTTTSIGVDYSNGGYGNELPNRWDGYKITTESSPLFAGTGLKNGDILSLPTREYDGAPVVKMIAPGSSEIPVIDNSQLNFYKIELLGYDFAQNILKPDGLGLGTFIVFQKDQTSGTIVNVASTNWCSTTGIGGTDRAKIETITKNMIDLSLRNGSLFNT